MRTSLQIPQKQIFIAINIFFQIDFEKQKK